MSTALQDATRKLPPRLQSIARPYGISLKIDRFETPTQILFMTTVATGVAPFETKPVFSNAVGSVVAADMGRIGDDPPQPYMLNIPSDPPRTTAWIEIPSPGGVWIITTPEIPCIDAEGNPIGSMTPQTVVFSIYQ